MIEMAEMNAFEREMDYYSDVAPNIDKIDHSLCFAPKCYFIGKVNDTKLIILEDLSHNGCEMADRLVGLDLEQCKMYFTKIGTFHALTAVYYENNKVGESFMKSSFCDEMKGFHEKCMTMAYSLLTDLFNTNDVLKPYLGAIKGWDTILFEAAKERTKINPDDFNVLNHGDSWVNNLLFTYNKNKSPTNVWLIDYQLACYGSPGFDILYFFITSPNMEVREHHFDELIEIYHSNLVAHLKKYNYSKPIPTLRQLHIDIIKKGFFATMLLIEIAVVVVLDAEDTTAIDKMLEDSENGAKIRDKIFKNPRYIRLLATTMKFLQNRGLLDV